MTGMPHKYIEIEDLVFALPNDFEGNCKDALQLLLEYILDVIRSCKENEVTEADTDRGIVMLKKAEAGSKVSIQYRMYEYNEKTKEYEIKPFIGSPEKHRED